MIYPKKQAEAQGIFQKTGGFVQGNMTLRDHFAGLAMQSLICAPNVRPMITDGEVSGWAYKMADAMLKAREA